MTILLVVLAVAPVRAQTAPMLTPRQAISRALAHNPELAADEPARQAARLEARASRAGYLPRLDFEQSYAGGNNPVYVFGTLLTQRAFTEANFALPSLNSPDPVDNLLTRFTVQQTIWDFGRSSSRTRTADMGVEIADRNHEEHQRQTILSVLDAYHSLALAKEAGETAGIALESAEAIERQARARVDSGLATEADLLRSRAYLAAARQRRLQARGRIEIARASLNRLMGESLDANTGEPAALRPASLTVAPEQELLAGLRERRPDYKRLLSGLRQAEIEAGARRSEFIPTIGAYGAWEADNPSFTRAGGNNWIAGVTLRWNIYAGGADDARLKAARHRVEQKRRQLEAMESAMALEVRRASIDCRSAAEQVEVAMAAESQSEESLRILKNRYDAGLATMTDLLAAETERSAARTALAEAVYRYRMSHAQLEYASGTLSPTSPATNP